MKVGDLVTTRSSNFIGVIIESRAVRERRSENIADEVKNIYCHYVYWSSSKVEKNPVWVTQESLVKVV